MPDLNSLPPSRSPEVTAPQPVRSFGGAEASSPPGSASPHSQRPRPAPGRRTSSGIALSLNLADPPGEGGEGRRGSSAQVYRSPSLGTSPRSPAALMGDPHHARAPSLGELHQELEQEQEAQVNRLLQMIRQQQAQLHQLQSQAGHGDSSAATDPPSATSSVPPSALAALPPPHRPRSPHDPLSRTSSYRSSSRRSRRSSRGSPALAASALAAAPQLPPLLPALEDSGGGRDEAAFYHAETQALSRENQMLRVRVRELERQLADLARDPAGSGSATPAVSSNLAAAEPVSADDVAEPPAGEPVAESTAAPDTEGKDGEAAAPAEGESAAT